MKGNVGQRGVLVTLMAFWKKKLSAITFGNGFRQTITVVFMVVDAISFEKEAPVRPE